MGPTFRSVALETLLSTVLVAGLIVGGLFGTTMGLFFAKLVNKIPVRSTYAKAVGLALVCWIVFASLSGFWVFQAMGPWLFAFAMFIFEGALFAFLFDRWTKTDF